MSATSKAFSCRFPNCTKTYHNKFNLKRHIEVNHGKSKRYRCRECGKYLSSKQNLKEHQNLHSQIEPYKCKEPFCGLSFKQASQYSNHKKLHREVVLMSLKLKEFHCLKLTDIFKYEKNEMIIEDTSIESEKVCLPNISETKLSVTLPRLSLHFCVETGELFDRNNN